jgi:hypothetical protein
MITKFFFVNSQMLTVCVSRQNLDTDDTGFTDGHGKNKKIREDPRNPPNPCTKRFSMSQSRNLEDIP